MKDRLVAAARAKAQELQQDAADTIDKLQQDAADTIDKIDKGIKGDGATLAQDDDPDAEVHPDVQKVQNAENGRNDKADKSDVPGPPPARQDEPPTSQGDERAAS
jgi:hypothetical protein